MGDGWRYLGVEVVSMLFRSCCFVFVIALLIFDVQASNYADEDIVVAAFSAHQAGASLPDDWRPLRFKNIDRHTDYQLARLESENITAIQAQSHASASGLVKKVNIDLKEYPIVQWRWRVDQGIPKSDVHQKAGDDYPARLYITFEYQADQLGFFERTQYKIARLFYGDVPVAAINYIWAQNAAVDSMIANAYTARAMMIVVEAGDEKQGQWLLETRNVYEDYVRAFGKAPPPVVGVAIMTDTDNTESDASAWYGDIRFKKKTDGALKQQTR